MSAADLALLVVDAANVVGSVPDGWWRDRAGATARLRDALRDLSTTTEPATDPARPSDDLTTLAGPPPYEVVLVVEGAARRVPGIPGVRVVAADGSGDDAIVELVAHLPTTTRRCVVVTADRLLRSCVTALGAAVAGPRTVRPR